MNYEYLNIIGLFSDLIGAIIITIGLIVSKKKAVELGAHRYMGSSDEENLKLPNIKERLNQSRCAMIGLSLLIIGFTLQIIANWPG